MKRVNWSRENKLIFLLFILSTSWFIYQCHVTLSWDFAAYTLNSKYWFNNGFYFEPLRPPLMPFLIGIFSFIGGFKIAEYLYVIFVSILFLFSSIKLANVLKFNRLYFYAISLNIYVLIVGLINGTELLSIVLLELFVVCLVKEKYSGHLLALSSLTRYNIIFILPLLVYYKNPKKIIKNLILFLLIWSPWLVYNFLKYGNLFASVFDNYALNVAAREYLFQPMNLFHILGATNFLTPFLIAGVICALIAIFKKGSNLIHILLSKKVEISMLFILAITLYSYYHIPMKDPRYLFSITVPTFYFTYVGVDKISKKFSRSHIFVNFLILFFLLLFILFYIYQKGLTFFEEPDTEIYKDAIKKLESFNLNNCSLMSNGWVYLNYLGRPSKPFPWESLVLPSLQDGEIILLFSHIIEPEYTRNSTFLQNFPTIYKDNNYILLGNLSACKQVEIFDSTYIYQLNRTIYKTYNYSIDTNYCNILFKNKIFAELCHKISYIDIQN